MIALVGAAATRCAADGASPSGDALFAAAQAAVARMSYPRYASYTVDVSFTKGEQRGRDRWDTHEDLTRASVVADVFSAEERANPTTPHGVNIGIPLLGDVGREKPDDPIGEVALAVDQTYGLAPARSYSVAKDVSTFSENASAIPTIGRTVTTARRYAVTFVDTVTIAGRLADHLTLTPLVNPGRDRLRELWIDAGSMAPIAANVAGIGNRAPTTKIAWHVEYQEREGGVYITRETALEPLDYGGDGELTNVEIAFEDLVISSRFPFKYAFGISSPSSPLGDP